MKNFMKNREIIDIDLPERDLMWMGICIEKNKNISILINYDEKKRKFNGYTVFRSREIKQYRCWEKAEYKSVKTKTSLRFFNKIKLKNTKTFCSSLKEASQFGLIAFFVENQNDSYLIGRLTSINNEFAHFRLIDTKAKWSRYKKIKLKNINYFSFDTDYDRALLKKAGGKKS
ncbi:hypothetical protein ACFL1E_00815 [Candidatus Omnitrophota bacterium]